MADRKDKNMKSLLEAALFISSRPLMLNELGKIMGLGSMGNVKHILENLQKEYADRGVEIANTPSGWQMQVNSQILPSVAHLTPYSDIPEGCKRTLALVVYKEPLKQSQLVKIQGNKVYAYIKFLEKRGLIKSERFSRTRILKVTKEFEAYFGESREKIKERIADGVSAIEREEAAKGRKSRPDPKLEKIKDIEGLNDFFSRMDKQISVQKKQAAEKVVEQTPAPEKPRKSRMPADLDELTVSDFRTMKKEK